MTRLEAGIADNVVPDRATATINFRYAPDRTPDERRGVSALADPGRRDGGDRRRLAARRASSRTPARPRAARCRRPHVEPKQAWTNVADFTTRGIDAVNFGPGATRYAHRRDELVEIAALERGLQTLRSFLDRVASRRGRLPDSSCAGDVSVRPPQRCGSDAACAGPRGARLRHGRPARADRPAHHRGAARRRAGADGLSGRRRAAGAARGDRGMGRPPLRRRARPERT